MAYNGIQNRAADTVVQSDLSNLRKKIELFKIDNNDLYPGGASDIPALSNLGFKAAKSSYATTPATQNNLWYCRDITKTRYSVVALSKSGSIFIISTDGGPIRYTGGYTWDPVRWNCNTMVGGDQGWQVAGYASGDMSTGPWRAWAGGN